MRVKSSYASACALFHRNRLSQSFLRAQNYQENHHRLPSSALAFSVGPFGNDVASNPTESSTSKKSSRGLFRPQVVQKKKNAFWAISKKLLEFGFFQACLGLYMFGKLVIQDMAIIIAYALVSRFMNVFDEISIKTKKGKSDVTFADVAGCDDEKKELMEVVDFLSNSTKYDLVGAKVPKGVLLEGPPGVGKTLLAKAVAGEAKANFIAVAGSEFVCLYVGAGAKRVREVFADARRRAPCILFIDEIDSIGVRKHGSLNNGEQEQTLNQILTEMDGFEPSKGVVVMAATNFAEKIDKAMMRPGRFDRHVKMELPDKKGREAILRVHSKKKPFNDSVNMTTVAANTIGMSGAELANLLNEAAMVTARNNRTNITHSDMDHAIDRVSIGIQKRSRVSTAKQNRLTAVHEAGHAVMAAYMGKDEMSVRKVTIVPRSGGVGGFTAFTPSQEKSMISRDYLERKLMISMGGRVAEEITFGELQITTGASEDLKMISGIAHEMVQSFGFTSRGSTGYGLSWSFPPGPVAHSPYTREKIDLEVDKIVSDAYLKCKKLMIKHKKLLNEVSEVLQKEETIDAERFIGILDNYKTRSKSFWTW